MDDLNSFGMVNPDVVQRLILTERPVATHTTVALHNAVFVFKPAKLNGPAITAITVHLTFSGRVLQWLCIFTDTTEGFGLWLRPVSVCALAGLCLSS
jgi:hypothetical protein